MEDIALEAEQASHALMEWSKKVGQWRLEMQDDQERSAKVIMELRAEVERLTLLLETTPRARLQSTDSTTASTEHLTPILQGAREENNGLQEQVEELQAQRLTRGLEEERQLVTSIQNNSLAAGFEAMSQEEAEQVRREELDKLRKKLGGIIEINDGLSVSDVAMLQAIADSLPQLGELRE